MIEWWWLVPAFCVGGAVMFVIICWKIAHG